MEKLKGAERALRSSMSEADSLKKQSIVDHEVGCVFSSPVDVLVI